MSVTRSKKKDNTTASDNKDAIRKIRYTIYHFGAEWCGPCRKMKAETWTDKSVKEAIDKYNAKLIMLDEGNKDHKKYFSYYKIGQYPTVIFLCNNDLDKPIYRASGFKDASQMLNTIKKELKNE